MNRLRAQRRGISLLEILVSIFILSVGLLGVAALLPVGNSQVEKATIAHRGSAVGQAAYRDMKMRGFLQPNLWLDNGAPVIDEYGRMTQAYIGKPLLIDPLTVSAPNGPAVFPHQLTTPAGSLTMPRLTLRSSTEETAAAMSESLTSELFVSHDPLVFDRPRSDSKATRQELLGGSPDDQFDGDKRKYNGLFSWMVMLVPTSHDARMYTASVIVHYREPIGRPRDEYVITNVQMLSGGVSGGDVRLSGDIKALKQLRPNRWIMLADAQGQYKWYRIVAVEGSVVDEADSRMVTLHGTDWDTSLSANPTMAVITQGVVGVFEKSVRIEEANMWQAHPPAPAAAGVAFSVNEARLWLGDGRFSVIVDSVDSVINVEIED